MMVLWFVVAIILLFGFVVFRGAPYVPSMKKYAAHALDELYPLSKHDLLVDVGSGDGVILRLAAERHARAIGYELNPLLVVVSRFLSRAYPTVQTKLADFWLVDLPHDTTIVYAFSVGRDMEKLARKMQASADQSGHLIRLITYGHVIESREPERATNSHTLYCFVPNSQ
jgi:hypothetical protein